MRIAIALPPHLPFAQTCRMVKMRRPVTNILDLNRASQLTDAKSSRARSCSSEFRFPDSSFNEARTMARSLQFIWFYGRRTDMRLDALLDAIHRCADVVEAAVQRFLVADGDVVLDELQSQRRYEQRVVDLGLKMTPSHRRIVVRAVVSVRTISRDCAGPFTAVAVL